MNDTALMVVGRPTIKGEVAVDVAPVEAVDLGRLRGEIDKLDAEILRLVQHRAKISRSIGAARLATGGPASSIKRKPPCWHGFVSSDLRACPFTGGPELGFAV
jgi:hypothetical protein